MLKSVWSVWFATYRDAFAMSLRIFYCDLHDDYFGLAGATPQFYSVAPDSLITAL